MDTNKIFTLKPEFIPAKNLIINFFIGIPLSLYIGFMFLPLIRLAEKNTDFIWLVTPIVSIVFLVWLLIAFYNEKLNYKVTEYEVYGDRIEFTEGFINSQNTTLMIKDIKEIHLKRNFFQNFYELGTIRFVTAANASTARNSSIFATGVNFRDIKNSKVIYAEMKKLVDEQQNKSI